MSLISLQFLGFLIIVVLAYYLVPGRYRWIVLLIASYAFYLFAGVKLVFFLLFTTLSTYFAGRRISAHTEAHVAALDAARGEDGKIASTEKKDLKKLFSRRKRKWMVSVLLVNFGILLLLKYVPVFSVPAGKLIAEGLFGPGASILLPLGISFYTFQSVGYIIDLYRGKFQSEKNVFIYALFVSFFPQIIQGPISRFDELAQQLYEPHHFDAKNLRFGVMLMLWGYFKKMVVADHLTPFIQTVTNDPEQFSGTYLVLAAALGWVQLYVDFSGGIDIARGVAEILGVKLPENFKRPFFADSLAEFWRRWHITLNNWWRDYIFYPLTLSQAFAKMGKRCRKAFGDETGKKIPIMLALLIVRFVNGIWHGAYLIYFVGGFYHGIILSLSFLWQPNFRRIAEKLHINTESRAWKIFRIVRTFILICIPRLLFEASSPADVMRYLSCTFSVFNPEVLVNGSIFSAGFTPQSLIISVIGLALIFCVSFVQERGTIIREVIDAKPFALKWAVYVFGLCVVLIFGVYGIGYDSSGFQYMKF